MTNDWTQYHDISESYRVTILTAAFGLTKNVVIDTLKVDYVFIHDKYYKVPKRDLLELLRGDILSSKPTLIELQLEETDL